MSVSRPVQAPGKPMILRNWQGCLGGMRRRPFTAAAVTLLCLLLIAGAGYFGVYPQLCGQYHWRQAQQATEAYDFPRAKEHLEQCLRIWPRSAETHFVMARACRRHGDLVAARRYLQEAKRLNWSNDAIDLEYKLLQAQSGAVLAVDRTLHAYIANEHRDSMLIMEALVLGYLQNNLLNDAHHWVTVWIRRSPDMWQPRFLRGRAYEIGLKPDLALQEYQSVLELNPDQVQARHKLAQLLLRRSGNYHEALEHFQICAAKRPDDPDVMVGVARCQHSLARLEVARTILDQLLTKHPKHPQALLLRGKLELEVGHAKEALPWLERSEEAAPHEPETLHVLAAVHRQLGKHQEAEGFDTRKRQIEKDLEEIKPLLEKILASEGPKETARNPKLQAKNADLRYQMGVLMLRVGREHEARVWLQSAQAQDPGHEPARRELDKLHKQGDRPRSAPAGRPLDEKPLVPSSNPKP